MMLADPHHDGSACYAAPGPHRLGAAVDLRVWVPHLDGGGSADHVVLRAVRDGEPHLTQAVRARSLAHGDWWHVPVTLVNPLTRYRFFIGGPHGRYRWLNAEGVHDRDTSDGADFMIRAEDAPPAWVSDAVAYQIFPDRFFRSDSRREAPTWATPVDWDTPVIGSGPGVAAQFYGGDLDGVAAKLDHLTDLGVNVIYLTPIFEGRSNHRYDAVTFDRVDPALGGDEALARLLEAAHSRGIRVVGDLTTNHTGREHEWFLAAQADANAPEAQYYRFHAHPDTYASWLDVPSLPKLDHASEELRDRFYGSPDSVVARWIRAGLDGWRIDVANMTGRLGADDLAHDVARAVRQAMHAVDPMAWLLAEHGHDAAADLTGDGWDGTMDYQGFTRPLWEWLNGGSAEGGGPTPATPAQEPPVPHGLDFLGLPIPIPVLAATSAVATMREVHAAMPWASQAASTLHLDSHDTPRFRTVAGGGTDGGVDRAGRGRFPHLLAVALQMTMPGVPSIFAGDEIGLTGINGEHSRTPFPWDRGEWDLPTYQTYQRWIALRTGHIALRSGGLRWVSVGTDHLTFLREHPHERLLIHAVRAPSEPVAIPLHPLGASEATLLEGHAAERGDHTLRLPGLPGASVWSLPTGDLAW